MIRTQTSASAHCCRQSEQGFLLAELLLSLAVGAVLAAMVAGGLSRVVHSWTYLSEQLQLQQAGQHIQTILEKSLGCNATAIRLTAQDEISYATIWGSKSCDIYTNKQGLYLRTTNNSGTGSNPLFIPDCSVRSWQPRRLDARTLQISFVLQGRQSSRSFTQILRCRNAEVFDERE